MSDQNTQNVPTAVTNERILGYLQRGEVEKVAQAGSDYTRLQIREDGFAFKILPASKATDDMLDRDLDERLRIIEELEPDSPGAKWVPFQTIPDGEYIYGSRYQVPFARVMTRKYQKDIDELRTYKQDLRKIFGDNSIKDALAEIDGKFITTCNAITELNHDGDGINNFTGKRQYLGLSGGITKDNWIEAKKLLPRGSSDGKFRLRNHVALMNDVTAQDWQKLDQEEIGNANVERMFNEGLFQDAAYGVKTVFTIKDDLIADNEVYFFAAPEFLGKAYYLNDWTMYMKKEAFFVEWFSHWLGGFAIGNVAAVCKVNFDASVTS